MLSSETKISLITGANSGIGKAAAIKLSKLKHKVIIVARNKKRGERALSEIKETTGNSDVHLYFADLSSIESIKKLSNRIKDNFIKIDILINNAGAYFSKRHKTVDGFEATFMVNYLSRFIFTNLLTELLFKSDDARIINISGESHRKGKINFDDLMFKKKYSAKLANAQSKLADIMFVYEYSKKTADKNINIYSVHPGAVATNIINNDPDSSYFTRILYKIFSLFFLSPEEAAESIVYLALSDEVKTTRKGYFKKTKLTESSPASYNPETANKLLQVSENVSGITFLNNRNDNKLNYI